MTQVDDYPDNTPAISQSFSEIVAVQIPSCKSIRSFLPFPDLAMSSSFLTTLKSPGQSLKPDTTYLSWRFSTSILRSPLLINIYVTTSIIPYK